MTEIRIDPEAARGAAKKLLSRAGLIIPAIVVIVGAMTSYFTVPADSEAVILRFGKYNRTAPSGLHFKMPFWFETKEIIPVARTLKMEFGFGTPGSTNEYQTRPGEHEAEQTMITGDKNSALVEWVVQYRINNPKDYLFRVRDPEDTMRDASESVMREVVGDRSVDEVITIGRQAIEDEALVKLQELVDSYGLGLQIDQLQLKNVNPPRPVQSSFNEVNQAQQDRAKQINVANGMYNKEVPRTLGEADQKISSAFGDKLKRVNEATGDAERFLALFKEYEKAPSITRQRLYLEKMQEVLPRLKGKFIMDEGTTKPVPLLDLNGALNGKGGKL
ncbi:MAG: FtsH protease activity modulator HflK [Akkermansiaceae bacterium]|jgi:membrane protease subunit HflK